MRSTPAHRFVATIGCGLLLLVAVFGAACSGPPAKVVLPPSTAARGAAPEPAAPTARDAWRMFGGTNQRNMVNTVEKDVPTSWSVEEGKEKNVKWSAKLGDYAYAGPVIADGKIFVGTNNQNPRDPKLVDADGKPIDLGVLMCFRESDGQFLWQLTHEKLPNTDENDAPHTGICSSPVVEGKRLYYVSNRCELVCAETEGDPATGKGKIVWSLDMIGKLQVYPNQMANGSPLIVGDLVYTLTSNGTHPTKGDLPAPKAPSFIAVDKKTGEVKWQSSAPGDKILEGQWSNPAAAEVNGVTQVIFPGGDGWLYAFEAKSGELLWKFDCNPKAAKPFNAGGRGDRNYIVATPVIYDNKLYVSVGQEPTKGTGIGHVWCVDITKKPANKDKDLSPVGDNFDPKAAVNKDAGLVWHYGGFIDPKPKKGRDYVFGRTIATVAIHDGLVYAADMDGFLNCLDAKTGAKVWVQDMKDGTWCSPAYVDGKVYIGTEGGDMLIYQAGKEPKDLAKINMEGSVKLPVVAVNGVLYVQTENRLYAIAVKK